MFQILLGYFLLGIRYAPFTDLIVMPFLAVLGFSLFSAGYMPLPRSAQKPFMGALLNTLLFFLVFLLVYPASLWFSEFRSFRSMADVLFVVLFLLEVIAGGLIVLAAGAWILKGPREKRSSMAMIPVIVISIAYAAVTIWQHHIGYKP